MDNTLSSMVAMTESDKTVNPKILDLPLLDLSNQLSSYAETSDTSMDIDPAISSNKTESISAASGTIKKFKTMKRKYEYRKDVGEIEKERLKQSNKLCKSLDDMVQIQKKRNKILAELCSKLNKE